MRVKIKNLGPLKQAEFSVGDLTILCGKNNTGKTYATYALFGFLSFWHDVFTVDVKAEGISKLLSEGVVHIDLSEYAEDAGRILEDGCRAYTKQLSRIFASRPERFQETEFQILVDSQEIRQLPKYERHFRSADAGLLSITKNEDSTELVVTLMVEKERIRMSHDFLSSVVGNAIKEVVVGRVFPNPFIASAERTGAAIFRKELNFVRNRLLEQIQEDKNVNPMDLLFKFYQDYPLPVKRNVDFTRNLEVISKDRSYLHEHYPDLLAAFEDIIGGEYKVTRNDELYYVPKKTRVNLSMDESSSSVRSLLDVGFYLRHVARPGDLLMVDEPELNLHPENQCRLARLFARLVNLGIKVFVTTHSDYIVKELNTLIMLNHDKPHLRMIAEREGYEKEELLSCDKIKVYIAEEALVKLDDGTRRTRCLTLTPADIDPELGIEARSFDTTIEAMNRIQEEIMWGAE